MTEVISLINEKGGVGKSTSAITIAQILAISEYKVLLIDLDPQMNTTKMYGQAEANPDIDYERLFCEKQKNKNVLLDEHIDKIVSTYKKREDIERYAHVASFDEIQENDFNLNIPRYVDTFEEEEPVDLVEVNTNLLKINEELVQQEQTLLSLIDDFSESEENQALIESMRLLLRGGHDE